MKGFEAYHPAVMLFYFAAVIFTAMFAGNPVFSLVAFFGASVFGFILLPAKKMFENIAFCLGLFIIIAVFNPVFSHNGETVLFFLNDKAVTLESILYGGGAALAIISVIQWFTMLNLVFTSDRLLYIFGGITQKTAVTVTMALRFIPMYVGQYKKVFFAHKAAGMFSESSRTQRIAGRLKVLSAVMTWALENAMDTSLAMAARGFGCGRRTSSSVYKIHGRDIAALALMAALTLLFTYGIISGKTDFGYYPRLSCEKLTVQSGAAYAAYGIMCFLPIISEIKEALQWKYCASKI